MTVKIDESLLYLTYSILQKISSKLSEKPKYTNSRYILNNNKNYEKIIPRYINNVNIKDRHILRNKLKQYRDDLKKLSTLLQIHLDNDYKIEDHHIINSYNKLQKRI